LVRQRRSPRVGGIESESPPEAACPMECVPGLLGLAARQSSFSFSVWHGFVSLVLASGNHRFAAS
jgi:hypothetical protein